MKENTHNIIMSQLKWCLSKRTPHTLKDQEYGKLLWN